MHHYPSHECRRLTSCDHDALRAVFNGLSERSRFLRFHTGVSDYPASWWSRLGRVEPGVSDAALAWSGCEPVGHAQWNHLGGGTAELALAVVDPWHRRGVGSALVDHLMTTAHSAGIDRFTCSVHPENSSMQRMLRSRGAALDAVADAGAGAWLLDVRSVGVLPASRRHREAA